MADEASPTPPEKPPEKKAEQPADTTEPPIHDEEVAAEQPAEAPEEPKSGVAAVAEAAGKEVAKAPGTAQGDKEGSGLFFPDAAKIRERARKAALASDTPKPAPSPAEEPQQSTPAAAPETAEEEEAEEAEKVTVQRPPPSPTPEARAPPPQPPQKTKKKAGIGPADSISGYLVDTSKDGKTSYALVINDLTRKDYDYLTFMCGYLADPVRQYIPIAHPTYLIKFSLNFVLQAIKEEIYENRQGLQPQM